MARPHSTLPFWDTLARASDAYDTLALTPDTPAFINYTSGTTGQPKGALQGHRSMLGHMPGNEMMYDFLPQPGDVMWSPADWSWLAGLMDVLMPAWFCGLPVLTYRNTTFDPEEAFRLMGKHRVTVSLLTPTMLRRMVPVRDPVQRHGLHLRAVASGGESVGRETLEWADRTLGVRVNEVYRPDRVQPRARQLLAGAATEAGLARPRDAGPRGRDRRRRGQ